jgi:sterol desaturase/sphingolipid hydroxylase (fatty acid hydroxylase superfamily)
VTNIRLFITLLLGVQSAFILADGWTAYAERRRSRIEIVRLSLFVLVTGIVYFAVQLALSSAVPDFHRLLAAITTLVGVDRAAKALAPGPIWMAALFAFAYVAGTLYDYLVHRFVLHRWMFVLHENHHLPAIVSNLMPGIAARPFVAIPNLLINAASALTLVVLIRVTGRPQLIGAFEQLALPLVLVFAFIACASHSSFLRRFDFVDALFRGLLIVTPREHLVHHAAHLEGNYGNFTMVWDRLFGTYLPPPETAPALGLPYDQDFVGSLTAGFIKMSQPLRAYFSIDALCRVSLDTTSCDGENISHTS